MLNSDLGPWIENLRGEAFDWELDAMEDPAEAADAFSRNLSFGTGGIRGLMGIGPNRMNNLTVGKAAQGLANYLSKTFGSGRASVAIGYDTRLHSRDFASVTASVLAANGIHVHLFGSHQPTPVLDFAVRRLGCSAGVVITASHNPMEYNGFKVYDHTGDQITDTMAHAIQAEIEAVDVFDEVVSMSLGEAVKRGLVLGIPESVLADYLAAMDAESLGVDASGLKVVFSPLNGTGLVPAKAMLNHLGVSCSLVEAQAEPDGTFPTCPKPNPESPAAMELGMAQAAREGADLFLATDPDADRIGVAALHDGRARILSGNEVGLLVFDFIARRCCGGADLQEKPPVAVTTIVSTPLADEIARTHGFELRRTLTGFKYAGEQIGLLEREGEEGRFAFGMEESCGYLRGNYVRDKDGICGLMLVCEVAAAYKAEGMDLVEALDALYERYGFMVGTQLTLELPGARGRAATAAVMRDLRKGSLDELLGARVERRIDYALGAAMPVVGGESAQTLPPSDALELRLADGCKLIVRPSGTEPKIKAYVFAGGATKAEADERLSALSGTVREYFDRQKVMLEGEGEPMTHVVLLSGGSGMRLWPLSNSARSKQFLKVLRDERGNHVSMVQRVFSQIECVPANVDVTIATSALQAESLDMQVPGRYALVTEPERRDTAPAIMLACTHLALEQGAADGDPVIVMPIDTYADQGYYDRIPKIAETVATSGADLVLLGVTPTYPSEKYGYIIPEGGATDGSEAPDAALPVRTFKEKPSEEAAAGYIAEGGLWNCGVFGFRLGYLRELTRRYYDAADYEDMLEHYCDLPKYSFDYEVVELAERIFVVPYSGTWKDLGTWNTLTEEMVEPTAGRVFLDEGTTEGVHAINETELPLVVAGVSDAVVVATPDGILVSGKKESAHIKGLVSSASEDRPMYEDKPWGHYRIVKSGDNMDAGSIKELMLNEGESVVLRAAERDLVFVVTSGSGEAQWSSGITKHLSSGSTMQVCAGSSTRVAAEGLMTLVGIVIL